MRSLLPAAGLAIAVGAALGWFWPDGRAHAGTAVRRTIPELLDHAGLVVEASVISARGLASPQGRPETEYLLDVRRTFWGEDLPSRAVRVPGGVLPDGSGMMIPGLPVLQPGERALLFLTEEGATGVRMTVGLGQGRMRILAGQNGTKWALREVGGEALVDARSGAPVSPPGSALPYAGLVATLEAAAVARRARERLEPR